MHTRGVIDIVGENGYGEMSSTKEDTVFISYRVNILGKGMKSFILLPSRNKLKDNMGSLTLL